jgi:hypothetical protein
MLKEEILNPGYNMIVELDSNKYYTYRRLQILTFKTYIQFRITEQDKIIREINIPLDHLLNYPELLATSFIYMDAHIRGLQKE